MLATALLPNLLCLSPAASLGSSAVLRSLPFPVLQPPLRSLETLYWLSPSTAWVGPSAPQRRHHPLYSRGFIFLFLLTNTSVETQNLFRLLKWHIPLYILHYGYCGQYRL